MTQRLQRKVADKATRFLRPFDPGVSDMVAPAFPPYPLRPALVEVFYRSREVAYGLLAASLLVLGSSVFVLFVAGASPVLIIPILLVPAICLLLVWCITIEVNSDELHVSLGMGAGRRVPLKEITKVSISKAPWHQGWGIRASRLGYLYRVTGFRTVDVVLKNGETIRLGTRRADELQRALRRALKSNRQRTRGKVAQR